MNMTLYFDDYGPAYIDTIGWILVATNSMTYRLITSYRLFSFSLNLKQFVFNKSNISASWWPPESGKGRMVGAGDRKLVLPE